MPCLIRRAAFHAWSVQDQTEYVFGNLATDDTDHAMSDDVRAMAMAIAEAGDVGLDGWMGVALSSPLIHGDRSQLRAVVARGLKELDAFLQAFKFR